MDRELERLVGDRAEGHCEYCRLPTLEWLRFQFDHIIAEKHHGPFEWNGVLLVGRSPIGRTTIDCFANQSSAHGSTPPSTAGRGSHLNRGWTIVWNVDRVTQTAREADVISTRIHLDRSGLLDAADFEKYFGGASRRTRRATQLQSK